MATEVAEIVVTPYTIYVAPYGTAMPKIDAAPADFDPLWVQVGTSGDLNYSDGGVTVATKQTTAGFTPAGSTTSRKNWRTDEGLDISFDLADISPEQFALAMDDAAITTVAAGPSVAGEKHFSLKRGFAMHIYALLARGVSSVDDTLNSQFQAPSVQSTGNPAPKFAAKGGPALLACMFSVIEVVAGEFCELHEQTAAAT